ncbi:hypothetical protein GCM10027570_46040 [Streptomonospora sediminis]
MAHVILLTTAPFWGMLAVFSAQRFVRSLELRRNGERVPGTVVSVENDAENSKEVRFRFETRDGRVMEVEPRVQSSFTRLRRGRRITVAYDPADPSNAEIIESKLQMRGYAFFALGGAIACVLSAAWGLVLVLGAGDRY